jgi:hypothetical protein
MSTEPISLLGGHSVYCINEGQLRDAVQLSEDPESGPRIQEKLTDLEGALSRNEQAALAFVIIERLRNSTD